MEILRTPSKNFEQLKDYSFDENYIEFKTLHNDEDISPLLRMHYLDENKDSDDIVLLLHGEPT